MRGRDTKVCQTLDLVITNLFNSKELIARQWFVSVTNNERVVINSANMILTASALQNSFYGEKLFKWNLKYCLVTKNEELKA